MDQANKYPEITIPGIFRNTAARNNALPFMKYRERGSWKELTWGDVKKRVDRLASFLIGSGIQPGDRLAVYSQNRPEWAIADLAALSSGACDVTIYPTNSGPEAAFILNDSGSTYCFCAGKTQVDSLLAEKKGLSTLKKIIAFDDMEYGDPMVITLNDALHKGELSLKEEEIDRRIRAIDTGDVMTLIYTSGTTGNPKGVMLTHGNMVANMDQFLEHHPFPFEVLALSLLPLSHSLERTVGYHCMLKLGGAVAYARGPEHLLEDLLEIRPTVFLVVPRVLEKLYQGITNKVSKAPAGKQKLFRWAERNARKAAHYINADKRVPFPLSLKYAAAEKLIFSKMRAAIGLDRTRCIGIGGAPLAYDIYEFFQGIGLECHIGFGLTETSPVTHVHTYHTIKPIKMDTAGPIVPRTECRIAEDGEIMIRGPQIMKGYYNRPDDTREVLSADGWFSTGDIGMIDADGYLRITDRKKDIIVTSGGKNIAPQVIENIFKSHAFIEQIAVVGDRRKYLTALVVPSFEMLGPWAQDHGVGETSPEMLIDNPEVIAKYGEIIRELNQPLGKVEQIKKFILLARQFTQETGELTPTLKVKRKAVMEKYKDVIEGMYRGDE
jgi:long-chain acyl-CoA synthetase